MKVKHVAMTSWFEHGPTESRLDTSMAQLSHIQVLPEAPEGPPTPSVQWSPALVLTVRSYVAGENTAYSQEQQSIIDRWELRERQQKLHSMFEQLSIGSGRSGNPLPTVTQLHKLEPIILPKIVISIHVMQLGKVICFAFSDGTVQYRDRLTMNEIYNDLNVERFMIPTQVGFQFAEEKPCK
jgi:mediator of RNA polymerase II transcription subunit 16